MMLSAKGHDPCVMFNQRLLIQSHVRLAGYTGEIMRPARCPSLLLCAPRALPACQTWPSTRWAASGPVAKTFRRRLAPLLRLCKTEMAGMHVRTTSYEDAVYNVKRSSKACHNYI